MTETKPFIALTDAEVWELEVGGRQLLSAPFRNVSREHIQVIAPGQKAAARPRRQHLRESALPREAWR